MLAINMELSMERTEQDLEDEWKTIDWKKVERYVGRIQGKIFLATTNKEHKKLKNLQKLARRSYKWKVGSMSPMNPELRDLWSKKSNFM